MRPDSPTSTDRPSTTRIVAASLAALAAALTALFVAVLPAEYGVDPLGTGRLLGLMPETGAVAGATSAGSVSAGLVSPSAASAVPSDTAVLSRDQATFEIGPYDYVEYKYQLTQGATMVFAWRATATVIHDFHGDPEGGDDHDEQSFDRRETAAASGTHEAPFPGLHGWMWENPGATPITVTLSTTGFYTSATEFRPNRRRFPHALTPALP